MTILLHTLDGIALARLEVLSHSGTLATPIAPPPCEGITCDHCTRPLVVRRGAQSAITAEIGRVPTSFVDDMSADKMVTGVHTSPDGRVSIDIERAAPEDQPFARVRVRSFGASCVSCGAALGTWREYSEIEG